jgi:hypothetical protein
MRADMGRFWRCICVCASPNMEQIIVCESASPMRLEMLDRELGRNFLIMDSRRWRLKPVDQLDDARMVHLPKCFDLRLVLARLLE